MESSRLDKAIDYFPLLAYLGFWIQGALVSSFITGDWRLMVLGVVTAPAMIAMVLAALKVRKTQMEETTDEG